MTIEVRRAGALTTVQDQGRSGYAHLGVPRSGALDQPALALANELVGNPPTAAGLELTLTGAVLRFRTATTVALTGAPAPLRVAGEAARYGTPVPVPDGAVVKVGPASAGVRSYLAVAGGVALPPVLGSRSTDTLSGLGPPPLVDGAVLPVGTPGTAPPQPPSAGSPPAVPGEPVLRLHPGPRRDWFTGESVTTLLAGSYRLSPLSNRIGARLSDGPRLRRCRTGELASEGMTLGAVQVPTDGMPLILLADHPTTGGYPVVAIVEPSDLPVLAQLRPGAKVTFRSHEGTQWT